MKSIFLSLLLASLGAHQSVAATSAEAETCYTWFQSLGFTDVKGLRWAEVWTGSWSQSGSEPPAAITQLGFIVSEADGSFIVLTKDLAQLTLASKLSPGKTHESVGFEERSFEDYARQQLKLLKTTPKDPWSRFGARLGQKAEVFFLSYCCWRNGHLELAQALFDETRKIEAPRNSNRPEPPKGMQSALECELGHQAMWEAVLEVGGLGWGGFGRNTATGLTPRPELLERFRRIVRLFPNSEHIERAKATAAILERMIEEDKAHRTIPTEEFAKLQEPDRVAELIFRLRDQNGHQWSQPGWCDVFNMRDAGDSPAHQLSAIGYPAVPALIEALDDERLSRSVGYHRNFYFSHTILTIGDCAQQILHRITGRQFYSPISTSGYMAGDL